MVCYLLKVNLSIKKRQTGNKRGKKGGFVTCLKKTKASKGNKPVKKGAKKESLLPVSNQESSLNLCVNSSLKIKKKAKYKRKIAFQ